MKYDWIVSFNVLVLYWHHTSSLSVALTAPFFSLLVKSPELGAQPVVYLAVSEDMEGVTGRYYDVMTEKEPAPQALDEEAACRLWEASSRLVGLEEEGLQGQSKAAQAHGRRSEPVVSAVGL